MKCPQSYHPSSFQLYYLAIVSIITVVHPSHAYVHHGKAHYCETQCSREAAGTAGGSLPKFEPGLTYSYAYEIETSVQLFKINNDDKTQSSLKGYAYLTVINPCYFHLSVTGLKSYTWLAGSEASKLTRMSLPESSIRFGMENGTIKEICATETDPPWSANLKKSIIYLLQTTNGESNEDFDTTEVQNDLPGRCPVKIRRHGNIYFKTKDLSGCTHRQHGPSFMHGVPYDTQNANQNGIPLLNSRASCKQEMYEGIVQSSVCSEDHDLKSIAADAPTVMISIKNYISFIKARNRSVQLPPSSLYRPSSLHYEHDPHESQLPTHPESAQATMDLLKLLCSELTSEDLIKEAPEHFLRLKQLLKYVDEDNVAQIYQQVTSGQVCANKKIQKIFLKTLIQTTTDSVIAFIANLTSTQSLDSELETEFLKRITFAEQPGRLALASMTELIQSLRSTVLSERKKHILLSASGMAFQYCNRLNPNCGSVPEYVTFVDAIVAAVTKSLEDNHNPTAVVALEALGNLKTLTPRAIDGIGIALRSKSSRIKIRALGAFRRDPCQQVLKTRAKTMLGNLKMGSDVRIHAYLALCRCLDSDDLQGLQAVIDNEQSNQVSSFLQSHISNQLESSSEPKSQLKSILRAIHLDKELPKSLNSVGKFSKNIEWSSSDMFSANVAGAALESNIIYCQDSYIPRTAAFNITVDMFGRSYNYLEAGVYLENFENILSRFNAPKEMPVADMDYEDVNAADNSIPKASNRSKTRRVNPVDLEQIQSQIQIKNRYLGNGAGDTYVRLHGTTVSVLSFQQNDLPGLLELLDLERLVNFDDVVELLKNATIERIKPSHFLDEHIAIATSSGNPINLKIQGSSVFSSKYVFNMDLAALWLGNSDGKEMSFKILPNVASTLSLGVSVGPELHETGFQFDAKTHLSAAAHFSLNKSENGLRLSYHFPVDKFRAVEFDGNLYWTEKVGINWQKTVLKPPFLFRIAADDVCTNETTRMLGGLLSPSDVGLKYCYYAYLPTLNVKKFAAYGPMSFRMTSEKLDADMKGFTLDFQTETIGKESAVTLTLDAPGSSKDRRITIRGGYLEGLEIDEVSLRVDYPSEQSPLLVRAQLHEFDLKGVTGSVVRGTGTELHFNLTVLTETTGENQEIYHPLIATTVGDDSKRYLSGRLVRDVGKSLDIDMELDFSPWVNIVGLKGLILANRSENGNFNFNLCGGQVTSSAIQATFNGSLYNQHPSIGFDLQSSVRRGAQESDFSISSNVIIIPSSKFAIKTTSVSSIPRLNIDFDLLAELSSASNGTQITLQTRLENYWKILAIRRAGDTFGSLELTADIARLKRRFELYTLRNHVDRLDLTKFDFESHLKWDVGRDEDKKMALKVGFIVNDTAADVTRYESSNAITFIGTTHALDMGGAMAKSSENGEYSARAAYVSPRNHRYSFDYKTVFSTEESRMAADNHFQLYFYPLPAVKVKWTKELNKTTDQLANFQAATHFTITIGPDDVLDLTAVADGVSDHQNAYSYPQLTTTGLVLTGTLLPVHIRAQNNLYLHYNESLDINVKVTQNPATIPVGTSPRTGAFRLNFKPDRKGSQRWYKVDINWTPNGQYDFIVQHFSFQNDFNLNFNYARDFAIRNDGLLRLSTGTSAWSKTFTVSPEKVTAEFNVQLPTSTVVVSLVSGLENYEHGKYALFGTTTQLANRPSFNFDLKVDTANPFRLFNTTLFIQNLVTLSFQNVLTRTATADTYSSVIITSIPDARLDTKYSNEFELSSGRISVQTGVQVKIGTHVNINGLFEGQLTKIDITEDAGEKWYLNMQYNRRSAGGQYEEPVVKCYGPIFRKDDSLRSTVLVEWPKIHHSFILVRVQADRDGRNKKNSTVILNLSGYDKRGNLVEELEKLPALADGQNNGNELSIAAGDDAPVFANFKVVTNMIQRRDSGRTFTLNFQSASSSSTNFDLPTSFDLSLTKSENRKETYCEFTTKLSPAQLQWFAGTVSLENVENSQRWKILTRRHSRNVNENPEGDISTGILWVKDGNNGRQDKSLCFVAEKVISGSNDGDFFNTCTLGFNSNMTIDLENGRISKAKFTLLDRIAFQSTKLDLGNTVAVNASFWLDIIDKPEEELRFSVTKKLIIRSGHQAVGSVFGPSHGSEYKLVAEHPFVPKSLQVTAFIGPDKDDWSKPVKQFIAEVDIFEQENDKILIHLKQWEDVPEEKPEVDDEFYGFGDDYETSTVAATTNGGGMYRISIESQGLSLKFEAEGRMELTSGMKYSFLDRDLEEKEGIVVLRIPSLLDSTVLQVGTRPIISVGFDGFPRIRINDPSSEDAIVMEYHGSPMSVRIFTSNFPEDQYYSVVIPAKTDAELTVGLQLDKDGEIAKIASANVALNTSKLLQLRADWQSEQMQHLMSDVKLLQTSLTSVATGEIVGMATETAENLKSFSTKVFTALPNIRPLLDKLDREIREDLEEIRSNPQSNIVYEFISNVVLQAYSHSKQAVQNLQDLLGRLQQESHQAGVNNWTLLGRKIKSTVNHVKDETFSAFALTVSFVKRKVLEVREQVEESINSSPELTEFFDDVRGVISTGKILIQDFLRAALEKTILLRPYLRWVVPKEVHEFLITMKHYSLGKLDNDGSYADEANNNVTTDEVLAKAYKTVLVVGRKVLEAKGWMFQAGNESALLQFPLSKPVRSVYQVVSKPSIPQSQQYSRGIRQLYDWLTSSDLYDTRTARFSKMKSKVENAFFGGVGPSDALSYIIGGKFYRTFDGKFHSFEGSCQYILTGDFLVQNLTIVTEGEDESREIIFSADDEEVILTRNGTVLHGNNHVEIPLTDSFAEAAPTRFGSFEAYRYDLIGEVVEVSRRYSGISVSCLVNNSVCTVRMRSYLYGRAMGLLGTNNLESYDEFSSPNGEIVGKTSGFYRNWRLNKECREVKGSLPKQNASPEAKAECSSLFSEESSPFVTCFSTVNPSDFHEVCEALATTQEATEGVKQAVCRVAAVYWIECNEQRVLTAPEAIEQCS